MNKKCVFVHLSQPPTSLLLVSSNSSARKIKSSWKFKSKPAKSSKHSNKTLARDQKYAIKITSVLTPELCVCAPNHILLTTIRNTDSIEKFTKKKSQLHYLTGVGNILVQGVFTHGVGGNQSTLKWEKAI